MEVMHEDTSTVMEEFWAFIFQEMIKKNISLYIYCQVLKLGKYKLGWKTAQYIIYYQKLRQNAQYHIIKVYQRIVDIDMRKESYLIIKNLIFQVSKTRSFFYFSVKKELILALAFTWISQLFPL